MRSKNPIACKCLVCGADFVRWRRRGRLDQCTRCTKRAFTAAWKQSHPDRAREINARSRSANRESDRASKSAWQKRNRGAGTANTRRRQCDQAQRTPPWADLGAIKAIYVMAQRARECTGIRFEVDHVVPLRGRSVSGLHVPHNLRLLTRQENMAKGNRYGA